jgi:hypothetical protein
MRCKAFEMKETGIGEIAAIEEISSENHGARSHGGHVIIETMKHIIVRICTGTASLVGNGEPTKMFLRSPAQFI